MKSTALLQQLGIALLLTGLAAINETLLRAFFGIGLSAKLNLSLIFLLYLGLLLRQNRLPAGRVTLMAVNLGIVLMCLLVDTRLYTLLWLYPAMIWLNRSLLRYAGVTSVLADLGLCLLSIGTVLWAFSSGYGFITALWCFLLLQALHVMIPAKKAPQTQQGNASSPDNFNKALQTAESALQQLLKKG